MKFTKMHGLGNDFIVFNSINDANINYSKLAVSMCNRHFGIGADGILIAEESNIADIKMLIFNSDGSSAEMCGNGIRCFAKYIYDLGIINSGLMRIETLDGIKEIAINTEEGKVKGIKVNMGRPSLNPEDIPVLIKESEVVNKKINIEGYEFYITSMLMGVPHTVIFVEDINQIDIEGLGKRIETSIYFPKKTNVNFVEIVSREEFKIRTWERGAGPTLACGTGTCASLVAGSLNNKTERRALAHLAAGDLLIEWCEDGYVYMTGPAETVFMGEYIV